MTFRDVLRRFGVDPVPPHTHGGGDISGDATFLDVSASRIYAGAITGQEIIIAGGAEGIIRSENFATGMSGWQIDGDGDAEFNDVIVRGVLVSDAGSDIDWLHVTNVSVGTADIENLAVTGAKIADATVTNAKIANLAVTGAKIANATITDAQISNLNADKINAGTITARNYRTAASGSRIEIIPGTNVWAINWWDGATPVGSVFYIDSLNRMDIQANNGRNMRVAAAGGGLVLINGGGGADLALGSAVSSAAIRDATTGSAANGFVNSSSGVLGRSTSARRYKSRITYNVGYLADVDLRPAKFYRKDDHRWFYGLIADDLADQDPLLGDYAEDGRVENYDDREVLAILAAKVNRLETQFAQLREAA